MSDGIFAGYMYITLQPIDIDLAFNLSMKQILSRMVNLNHKIITRMMAGAVSLKDTTNDSNFHLCHRYYKIHDIIATNNS